MMDAGRHPRIEVLTHSEVTALAGEAGRFRATVRTAFSGVDVERCTGCGDCADACPVTAPNPFDVGLGTRKAIFRPFPQAVPAVYAIDPELCLNQGDWIACERCRRACPREAIDLERHTRERALDVGAVVVATGFDEFDPHRLRNYGYGVYPNVVTSLELERLLNASGPTLGHVVRPSDHRPPRQVVYVQCVGARGEAGRPYCSRFCCMNAVKDALLLKQHDPDIEAVTILYTDLRAFGKGFEDLYARAQAEPWIHFVRGRPAKIEQTHAGHDLAVLVEDTEHGRPRRIGADLVVLSCAGSPAAGTDRLAARLGVETNRLGFLATRPDNPIHSTRPGVFVCGGASGPQVIPDCVAQGSAAAVAAATCAGDQSTAGTPAGAGAADRGERLSLRDVQPGTPATPPDVPTAAQGPLPAAGDPGAAEPAGVELTPEDPHYWPEALVDVAEAYAAGSWSALLGESQTRTAQRRAAPCVPHSTHAPSAPESADTITPIEPDGTPRIGLFLCHCGINIAGVLDMERLREYAATLPGVVHASQELFACSASAQETIRQAIQEHQLNRIVVAACTPRTHEPIFRQNCRAAGLNPYLLEMVNIRDQCSWVHTQHPAEATAKARDLLRMAVARARRLQPLEPMQVDVTRRLLVVGGGLPGMKAASDLHALGFEVVLIERAADLGGLLRRLHDLYPDGRRAGEAIERLLARLTRAQVEVLTGTELAAVDGYVGNFRVRLTPVSGTPEKNGSTAARRAPESAPSAGRELEVGGIVLATGARAYRPGSDEFGYGRFTNVITSLELEARLAAQPNEAAPQQTIAFIQCVGSRTRGNGDGYRGCSRICCPTTIKQARALRAHGHEVIVYYRDLRMVDPEAEENYRAARGEGVVFVRVPEAEPPRVSGSGERAEAITTRDQLLHAELHADVDLVVLAVGLVPDRDATRRIQELLKTPQGSDGFFLERHPELGPVETCVDGVWLCGTAQGPKGLAEACVQASAAAARAAVLLGEGTLQLDPAVCRVAADRCRACGLCVSICEFQAPRLVVEEGGRRRMTINAALCKGCGTCAVWCPTGAIEAQHFTDNQIAAMIDSLFLEEAPR